jgi:hypothetical protein
LKKDFTSEDLNLGTKELAVKKGFMVEQKSVYVIEAAISYLNLKFH